MGGCWSCRHYVPRGRMTPAMLDEAGRVVERVEATGGVAGVVVGWCQHYARPLFRLRATCEAYAPARQPRLLDYLR